MQRDATKRNIFGILRECCIPTHRILEGVAPATPGRLESARQAGRLKGHRARARRATLARRAPSLGGLSIVIDCPYKACNSVPRATRCPRATPAPRNGCQTIFHIYVHSLILPALGSEGAAHVVSGLGRAARRVRSIDISIAAEICCKPYTIQIANIAHCPFLFTGHPRASIRSGRRKGKGPRAATWKTESSAAPATQSANGSRQKVPEVSA